MQYRQLLDLKHLQMIHSIAAHGRVSDAAEALGLTASALSHRIREAERRLDVPLYTRLNKRIRMTPAAELLAGVAERILTDLEHAEADVRRMNRGVDHVIRIATETYGTYHWLPAFLPVLAREFPGVELHIVAMTGREPLHALVNRSVDLVIASDIDRHADLHMRPFFDDELLFIVPPDHRHAGKPFVEAADILGETFVTTSKTPRPDREFARLFRPGDSYPSWAATVELPEAIIELVAAGQATSVLANWAVRPALQTGKVAGARLGKDGISVSWNLVSRKEDAETGVISDVADLLIRWADETGIFREGGH